MEYSQNLGKQGESIWGKPFKDEIGGTYKHDQPGVLSMANRGSDTNRETDTIEKWFKIRFWKRNE